MVDSPLDLRGFVANRLRFDTTGSDVAAAQSWLRDRLAAGIPTVVFGPGSVEQAHLSDETLRWADVELAREALSTTARTYLGQSSDAGSK